MVKGTTLLDLEGKYGTYAPFEECVQASGYNARYLKGLIRDGEVKGIKVSGNIYIDTRDLHMRVQRHHAKLKPQSSRARGDKMSNFLMKVIYICLLADLVLGGWILWMIIKYI